MTLLDQIDRLGDERRLQGLFVHAWRHCADFRQAFCDRLQWPVTSEIREEGKEEHDFRADIIVGSGVTRRVIELKVWQELSPGQLRAARRGRIDLIVAPKRRLRSVKRSFGKRANAPQVMSWQDVETLAAATAAHVLFVGVGSWLEDGTQLSAALLPNMLRACERRTRPAALRRFMSAVQEGLDDASRFEVTSSRSAVGGKCRYLGFDVTYSPGRGKHGLWAGFLWSPGRKQVLWAVQDCEEHFEQTDLPQFAIAAGEHPGRVVWSGDSTTHLDPEAITSATILAFCEVMGRSPASVMAPVLAEAAPFGADSATHTLPSGASAVHPARRSMAPRPNASRPRPRG
jgi:hypothetical protein